MKNSKFQIQNSKFLPSKGVALIWSLLISSVLLVMAFTMVILVVKELRISSNMDESNRAYTAAESGMERGLYEVKRKIDENIEWGCDSDVNPIPPINQELSTDPLSRLRYSVIINVACTGGDTDERQITLESEGVSREMTLRKLRITTTSIKNLNNDSNIGNINTYEANPFSLGERDYYSIAGAFLGKPIIIQQFDLTNFAKNTVGGGFTVGMSDARNSGNTDFGVKFSQASGGPNITMALDGKVGEVVIPESPESSFDIQGDSLDRYRVKLEYSGQGLLGVPNQGYSVVRAIILKRDSSSGRFECLESSQGYVVYSGVLRRGNIPQFVKISGSGWNDWNLENFNGYIKVGSQARLDNMVFWGIGD